ncbi:MAG: transglutaminase family protein, partial [Candidatus Heimdallarchaeota archaeon]|nr:transglutaminase family protein [Candidatus Heimdallarchaeota archaeon]
YLSMLDKYRDLPPGDIEEQLIDPDWFNANFQGSAPFYIDGLLDLLDALDFNATLGNQEVAEVFTDGFDGDLGNFLYRWEVHDYYDSTTWEFSSNDAVTDALQDGTDYGPPDPTAIGMDIKQLAYSATTTITSPLLTTWSSYNYPHLSEYSTDAGSSSTDWDNYLFDENDSIASVDGSTDIVYTKRDQLLLQSSAEILGFVGTYHYSTYFVQDDTQTIINDCTDAYTPGYATDPAAERFLQIPTNYDTTSPGVITFAEGIRDDPITAGFTFYERAAYIIDKILLEHGTPTADLTDNGGRDRAQLLIEGSDSSISAFLALTIMTLRLNEIPARPVFGFAIGSPNGGDPNNRTLTFSNLYGWVEALLPIDEGGIDPELRWGQLQIGPYPSGVDLVYCENTLYTSYDVDVSMYEFPTYNSLPTQVVGSDEVYVLDNLQYVVRADVLSEGSPVEGAVVNFKAVTSSEYQTYQTNPAQLLAIADNLGEEATNIIGRA